MPTATTYIKLYKKAADKSTVQTMQERFEYALNPENLDDKCPCCGKPASKMVYWGVAY